MVTLPLLLLPFYYLYNNKMPNKRKKPTKKARVRKVVTTTTTEPTTKIRRLVSSYRGLAKRKSTAGSIFPMKRHCSFLYKNPSTTITTAGVNAFYAVRIRCNSLFDVDFDNLFGDKQPLYYDSLLSGTGPYRNYKVNAWKTIIKIVNLETTRTLMAYFDPGSLAGSGEADTATEIRNRAYVQSKILTPVGSGGGMATFVSYRKTKSFSPTTNEDNYTGNWDGNPSNVIFSTLNVIPVDSQATAYNFMIEVTHIQYATLFNSDAVVS